METQEQVIARINVEGKIYSYDPNCNWGEYLQDAQEREAWLKGMVLSGLTNERAYEALERVSEEVRVSRAILENKI